MEAGIRALKALTESHTLSPQPSSSEWEEDEEAISNLHQEVRFVGKVESIFDLPQLVIEKIFAYFSYDELTKIRCINRSFDSYAKEELNKGFEKLGKIIDTCRAEVKKELPKRESERRKHRMTKINELYNALDTRYSLLDLTFKKFMKHSHPSLQVCFMPGKVMDEFHRVLHVIKRCRDCGGEFTGDSSELLKELRDLSSMAMEYYEENILPKLEDMAERAGVNSLFFTNLDSFARNARKKTKRMCRDSHASGRRHPRMEMLANDSPVSREIPKTMQDKIDEQQKKIDAQQLEIDNLRETVVSTLELLKSVLPTHSLKMNAMLQKCAEKDNHKKPAAIKLVVQEKPKKRLFSTYSDEEEDIDQPSTSTAHLSKKQKFEEE